MTTTTKIDFKGLTEGQVQIAIDNYLANRATEEWRSQANRRKMREQARRRNLNTQRTRVVNALKKAGFRVRPLDSYSSSGLAVSRIYNYDAWHDISLQAYLPSISHRASEEIKAEYKERAAVALAQHIETLSSIPNIEFRIREEEHKSWDYVYLNGEILNDEDGNPVKVVKPYITTRYEVRLAEGRFTEEEGQE